MRILNEYALYEGDTFVCLGTIKEIAEFTGLKEITIRGYGKKSYRKKNEFKDSKILIKIET